jgi:hypothetical protein
MDKVVWGIFWKVFRRSCGPPTRSIGSTDKSVGLLVGRTHLSGMAVSLVGGDPGVPMSHSGSSGNDCALSSPPAPGPILQRLDVRLRMRLGGFSFF